MEITFDDACIVFPLRRESLAFYREFPPQQSFPGAPCPARFCGPSWLSVLVLETGLGRGAMAAALAWALHAPLLGNIRYRPKLVLSAGFCGALDDQLQVGDVILATAVADEAGGRWAATWPGELPPGEWRPSLHRGRLLTVDRLIYDPAEKRHLGQRYQALAVDMETALVAEQCHARGIPFGAVRAVSDSAATPLSPRLASLLQGGRVSLLKLLRATLSSPALIWELFALARATQQASRNLALALGELLTLTLPWATEAGPVNQPGKYRDKQ